MAYRVVKNLTKINFTDRNDVRRIKYIVIHYFGSLGTAKAVANWFASAYRGASAHYSLDEGEIIYQSVEDEDIAWHCGTRGTYRHPKCRNSNSIGIEVRPRKLSNKTIRAEDKDWYFEDATVDRLVEFVRDLMVKYNVPIENVVRHFDVTGKWCPRPYMGNDINEYYNKAGNVLWNDFLSRLRVTENKPVIEKPSTVVKVGDKVKLVTGAKQYNGNAIAKSYKSREYVVKEIKGDRAVLTINGVVIYAVNVNSLVSTTVKDTTTKDGIVDVKDFLVRVTCDDLNIRSGPGTSCSIVGKIKDRGVYTITHKDSTENWGKLKSGAGWIHLGCTKRV